MMRFNLIIASAFSLLFLGLFGMITVSIHQDNTWVMIDEWVIKYVLSLRNTLITSVMKTATILGEINIVGILSFVVMAYLLLKKHYYKAASLAAAVFGGMLLNNFLKIIIHRPRPLSEATLITAYGWSFPSGHAMNSIIFYGFMAFLIIKGIHSWTYKALILTIAVCIVFIIGLSRIYLQVHYLSDVIAGFAAGLFWLSVCLTGFEILEKRDNY